MGTGARSQANVLCVAPISCGYTPVIMAVREGTHNGCVQYALWKRTPREARPSRAGVERSLLPAQLMAPAHCWSVKMYTRFGR